MSAVVVIKKDGREEAFSIDKIRRQIHKAVDKTGINPLELESMLRFTKTKYKTSEIQDIVIETGKNKISKEQPEYNLVTGRLSMNNLYNEIWKNIRISVENWEDIIKYLCRNGYYKKSIVQYLKRLPKKTKKKVTQLIVSKNYDFNMLFSQVEVLKTKYLIKHKKGFIEYPVIADIANALLLSGGNDVHFFKMFYYIHFMYISLATPFKRNLRRPNGNTGSCFIGEVGDSLSSILKANSDIGVISKFGGGIGWYFGKVRPGYTYSYNVVEANPITKWIKIVNDIIVAVDQGGTRKGAITIALDWWHMDIFEFLSIKSELDGDLRDKAFDIFPQIVVDNYFIEAVYNKQDVYIFNQYEFQQKTGIDITELIEDELLDAIKLAQEMAANGKISGKKVPAKDIWKRALWVWIEIGDFYITHKDMLNFSNYMKYDKENGGISKCGNLCVESFSFSKLATEWEEKSTLDKRETTKTNGRYHSCSLVSISLPKFIEHPEKLPEVCYYATLMLDRSIDIGEMPVLEAKLSSQEIRNIGIGKVGMADYMAYNKVMFDSEDGLNLAESITELISYHCYKASISLAKEFGPYPAFKRENYQKLLGRDPEELNKLSPNGLDWVGLHSDIMRYGIRNMLINADAPNTTTGIMMGASPSILPIYNKDMSQTLSDMVVTILPMFIKERYWYYKTRFQYNPVDIIRFTRRLQRWVDTGISMEINIDPDIANIGDISKEIIDAFRAKELKAVYYSLTIGKDGNANDKNNICSDCKN